MARRSSDPEFIVRVSYVVDPDNARAAQDILREGFRRGLLRLIHENRQKDATSEA
jgi:hypothetical protein